MAINTKELYQVLDATPATQNLMFVGKHGIGKSEMLTQYFSQRGMPVVALFLGQMSAPGDLIGLPRLDETTAKINSLRRTGFPLMDNPSCCFSTSSNAPVPKCCKPLWTSHSTANSPAARWQPHHLRRERRRRVPTYRP